MREQMQKIGSILLLIVVISFMMFVYIWEQCVEQARHEAQLVYEEKSRVYQQELDELRLELHSLSVSRPYYGEHSHIMVGYTVNTPEDITYIREQASAFEFTPVLILDAALLPNDVSVLLDRADPSWEIMLWMSSLDESTADNIAALRTLLKDQNRIVCDVAFYRSEILSNRDHETLRTLGFGGTTIYHDSPKSGQTEDDLVYFDFSRLTKDDMSLEDRLSQCCDQNASMIYIFDMDSIRSGNLSAEQADAYLETIFAYNESEKCVVTTVEETFSMLSAINESKAEHDVMMEEKRKTIQLRINELGDILEALYHECYTNVPW